MTCATKMLQQVNNRVIVDAPLHHDINLDWRQTSLLRRSNAVQHLLQVAAATAHLCEDLIVKTVETHRDSVQTRARLSADGVLYTCLFATQGTDLREPLRNGADDIELADILSRIWLQRADRYSELRRPDIAEAHPLSKVEMYRIGG